MRKMDISSRFARFPGYLVVPLLMLLGPAMAADTGADRATELAQAAAGKAGQAQPPAPARFEPTEKIKADTVVDFPVDI